MNCWSLDSAEMTSPSALKLLLIDWASCGTYQTYTCSASNESMAAFNALITLFYTHTKAAGEKIIFSENNILKYLAKKLMYMLP